MGSSRRARCAKGPIEISEQTSAANQTLIKTTGAGWQQQGAMSAKRCCDRGIFMTKLFADRLSALGESVKTKGVAKREEILLGFEAKPLPSRFFR
jgi:hypothetical protein